MIDFIEIPSIREIFNREEYKEMGLLAQLVGETIVPENKVRLSKTCLDGQEYSVHHVNYTSDQVISFSDGTEQKYSDVIFIRGEDKPFFQDIERDRGALVRNEKGEVVGIMIAGDQYGNAYVAPAWQLVP